MNNYEFVKFKKSKLFLKRSRILLKSSLFKIIFSRFFLFIIFIFYQIFIFYKFSNFIYREYLINFYIIFNIIALISIINSNRHRNEYKILWIVIFIALPFIGVLIYFLDTLVKYISIGRRHISSNFIKLKDSIKDDSEEILYNLNDYNNEKSIIYYLNKTNGYNTYYNKENTFFSNGREYFDDLFYELNNAKKYIFIEVFLLYDGEIWKNLLNILKKKAKEGVEVKLLIDGLSTMNSFGSNYYKKLKEYNIGAKVFNRILPLVNFSYNYRDHRKIIVIDDNIAYTGGMNIGDEYANIINKYGDFKDTAIKITGNAVNSFKIMFLSLFYYREKNNEKVLIDIKKYLTYKIDNFNKNDYIIPFDDYPRDTNYITEKLFLYLINSSKDKLYITTPYLILNEIIKEALIFASNRGVDVRIIVPHVPDKKIVFLCTRSHYEDLINNNIKIYEYTPGFIHSKMFYQDGKRVLIGTANLDYRSLYLNFENMCYIYNNKVIEDIYEDFLDIINKSIEINKDYINNINFLTRLFYNVVKIFAPLF